MRIGSLGVVALLVASLAVAAVACKSSDKAAGPRKLRKMDFHTQIDERGRLRIAFRLFDGKHEQMPVTGSYTVEVTKPDGAVVCKAAGALAPGDFSAKGTHQAPWHEAGCPADPGADEVKVNVKVTVPAGDGASKEPDAKGAAAAKDTVFDRSVTIPVRSIYERPPTQKLATSSAAASSAATSSTAASSPKVSGPPGGCSVTEGAATGSAATSSTAASSTAADCAVTDSAATGSAAKPAEKPTAAKPAEKPTAEKPAEKPTAEKPAEAKPAAGSAR
ncbi:MAG TPA: hypothetical protein VNO30_23695 [Kofleriaceae bacterium]|nr:hypothetical protein [Kofleriaceae bacterium]